MASRFLEVWAVAGPLLSAWLSIWWAERRADRRTKETREHDDRKDETRRRAKREAIEQDRRFRAEARESAQLREAFVECLALANEVDRTIDSSEQLPDGLLHLLSRSIAEVSLRASPAARECAANFWRLTTSNSQAELRKTALAQLTEQAMREAGKRPANQTKRVIMG